MKKQTLRIAASAATVGVMSIVGFGMVAHAEPNPIKAVGQSFSGIFHRHGGHGPMQSLTSVAAALNMSEADVQTQLDAGKSLADIAAAQKVNVQSVIDAVVADMKAHVATEVTSGEITQAEADAKLADVVARATDMVNGVRPAGMPEGMAGGMGGHGPSPESITALAKVLNLTEAQLQTEVQSGKSLADIATAQKVSVQSVIDAVVAQMKTHIASEVTSGEITQAEADAKLADVVARATDMVNGVRPAGMPGDKVGGMGGHGRGHHGMGDDGDDDGETNDDGGVEDSNA
jgi:phosphoglycolate phosphatase-like HAD superfamily hydrolase